MFDHNTQTSSQMNRRTVAFLTLTAIAVLLLRPSFSIGEDTERAWTFDQPRDAACFTLREIVKDGAPILYVTHDSDDHAWQFLTGEIVSMDRLMIVSMAEIVSIDPSVLRIGHIPPGHIAVRDSVDAEWRIRKAMDQNDDSP